MWIFSDYATLDPGYRGQSIESCLLAGVLGNLWLKVVVEYSVSHFYLDWPKLLCKHPRGDQHAQFAIAFPLRFIKKLIERGLLREGWIF